MNKLLISLALLLLVVPAPTSATEDDRPTVVVFSKATVSGETITLGDIARINAKSEAGEKIVTSLEAIELGTAPEPSEEKQLMGVEILSGIEASGVSLESIGYFIPQAVVIERKGRTLTEEEVIAVLKNTLLTKDDINTRMQVKGVHWTGTKIIPTGSNNVSIESLGIPQNGKLPIRISVFNGDDIAARFLATAQVERWRQVPVLTRNIERGMLIEPQDVKLLEVNLSRESNDIVEAAQELIGRRARSRLRAGSYVRKSSVDIPPLVSRGSEVTIKISIPGLQATATGKAMEDGLKGDEIQVQNASARKVLRARIIGARLVEVLQ